jgi:hypothetical protein
VDGKHRSKQKHPILRSERRLDLKSVSWKSQSHWNNEAVQKAISTLPGDTYYYEEGVSRKRKNNAQDMEEPSKKSKEVACERPSATPEGSANSESHGESRCYNIVFT